MDRKKILILGGGGYVGGALTREFLRRSEPVDIVTFDSYWFSKPPTYTPEWTNVNAQTGNTLQSITGDIRNFAEVDRAMQGIDVLIHLACISNDPGVDLNPRLGREINYDSLNNIMQSARDNDVERVIYASSSAVYGASNGRDCDERSNPKPMTDYAKYKWYSERKINSIWESQIPITILRPATLCGWADTAMRFDLMFNSFVAQAILDGVIIVKGGKQTRALLALKDMVECYVKLTHEPDIDRIAGKVWNVGHGNYDLSDLASMVAKWRADDGYECSIHYSPTNDLRSYAINVDAIENEFDFVATTGLHTVYKGLREKLMGERVTHWNTPEYIRVKRLKELHLA